jgi:hypothetical protein
MMRDRFKQSNTVSCSIRDVTARRVKRKKIPWPVFLFLSALVVPWMIFIGPLRMSLYRIVLLVMVLPCLGIWMSGKAGRIRTADIALLLFWFWGGLSYIVINGMALSVQPIGIGFIETVGAYLLARCYIRDADDFYNMIQLLFRIVVFLLPFAAFECVTGQNILRDFFATFLPTRIDPSDVFRHTALPETSFGEARGGLSRVYSVFDHPILFGVITGSIFALVHQVLGYQKSFLQRSFRTGIVGATSILSLSAGPLIVIVAQVFLLSWNRLLSGIRFRWIILIGLFLSIVLVIELVANRSALEIVVAYFLFDPASYWFRKMIWDFGSASVLAHPVFGVGMNEWQRPEGMPPSIDNFWLAIAVHYGLPGVFLLLLALFSILLAVGFRKGLEDKLIEYRTGFLISLSGFLLAACTVTFWDAAYVFLLFLMGSGVWMLDVETEKRACS